MIARHVIVLPYDEQWEKDFQAIRDEIEAALSDIALQYGSWPVRRSDATFGIPGVRSYARPSF
ncbi:MAG: hypothetical protein IKG11_08465 [Atopobiaceae bacterium]|nr:hypothetical protein [Atopobiaceae bacterium]